MVYLFNDWESFSSRIERAKHVFLFLDYDGTLTPIVSTPENARLSNRSRSLLKDLSKDCRFSLAVISGRSLRDIKKTVGLKGIVYAGNHGLEMGHYNRRILRPGISLKRPPLKTIYLALKSGLSHIKGIRVEDKGCTLSVHFRLVRPRERALVKRIFNRTVKPYLLSKSIRTSSGKMVLEVRPAMDWNKGRAVLHLLGKKKGLPVYIGDDVTDIDAFRAIKGKGISIFVGGYKKNIGADYFLRNPKEVEIFLGRLVSLN